MLRSFYIAGTGMMTQRAKMDVVINNITNADTTSYKKDHVISRSFADMLLDRLHDPSILNQTRIGGQNTGIYVDELVTNFTQGPMETTEFATDLAIVGDGFFRIQTPQGERYTRSGNFQLDAQGSLLTQEGHAVLDANGNPIRIVSGEFVVKNDGSVYAGDQYVTQIGLVKFTDNGILRKTGDNLYVPYNGERPTAVQVPNIQQNMLEGSNVEIGREVADMMMTYRVYESSQRILRMIDESLGRTVNDIGKF